MWVLGKEIKHATQSQPRCLPSVRGRGGAPQSQRTLELSPGGDPLERARLPMFANTRWPQSDHTADESTF